MRVLVFSDSHGRAQPMLDAVSIYRPDAVFHLGDVIRDGDKLREAYPDLPCFQVAGNCDLNPGNYPLEYTVELAGKTVFYLHGHTQYVKSGTSSAVRAAQSLGADILLFGHTHRPLKECYGGLLAVNPGAILDGRCALLTWERGGEAACLPLEL